MKLAKFVIPACLLIALMLFAARFGSAGEKAEHEILDRAAVREAADLLKQALSTTEADRRRELCTKAKKMLGQDVYAANRLDKALDGQISDAEIKRIHESLTFRPWMEAELPEGFPEFTPLHHIEVKKYPRYRLAQVTMKPGTKGDSQAFWTLFQHIKRNDIEMTAPVQTEYDKSQDDMTKSSMAFLYETSKLGELGRDREDKRVDVKEYKPIQVVSIGVRGNMTEEAIREARKKLTAWLQDNQDSYRQTGPLRTMGYNSPFIPSSKKYFEVQIPVESARPAQKSAS